MTRKQFAIQYAVALAIALIVALTLPTLAQEKPPALPDAAAKQELTTPDAKPVPQELLVRLSDIQKAINVTGSNIALLQKEINNLKALYDEAVTKATPENHVMTPRCKPGKEQKQDDGTATCAQQFVEWVFMPRPPQK